jgi:hypothetical protein
VSEAGGTGDQRDDDSGLGNTPDRKKTHSAPELVRSGHLATELSRADKKGCPTWIEHPWRAVRELADPGQQPPTVPD